MDAQKKQELYRRLKEHHGSMKEVAKRANRCHSYVYRVLTGKRKNKEIVTVAAQVLVELTKEETNHSNQQAMLMEQVEALVAQSFG